MPDTRYKKIETYDNNSNLIATEQKSYEVSDGELIREEAGNIIAQLSAVADAEMTTNQLKQLVKALATLISR